MRVVQQFTSFSIRHKARLIRWCYDTSDAINRPKGKRKCWLVFVPAAVSSHFSCPGKASAMGLIPREYSTLIDEMYTFNAM